MVNNVSYDSEIKSNSGIVYYGSSSDSSNSDGHAAGYPEVDLKSFDFCYETEEVEKLILENQEEELPIFLNPSVFRKIVRERALTWKDPVNDLLEFSTRNLKRTIAECIDYSIGVSKFKSFIKYRWSNSYLPGRCLRKALQCDQFVLPDGINIILCIYQLPTMIK